MRNFCFPLFAASLTLAHISACWSFHRSQCLNKWSLSEESPSHSPGHTTSSGRPVCVRALQVHTREGMPGLELVEP